VAGPGARPAPRGRHRGRPRDGDGVPAAVAGRAPPREPARHARRGAHVDRLAPGVLPELPGLPRGRRADGHRDGRALRGAPGARAVARQQRVRRAHAALLLRGVRARLPRLARAPPRDLDALNAAWGTAFWSQRYGRWEEIQPPRSRRTRPTRRRSSTSAASAPTRCWPATTSSATCSRGSRRTCRSPRTSWGCSSPWTTGRGRRARTWSPTTPIPIRRIPSRTSTPALAATSCGPCAAGSRGCSWSRRRAR
jgi:hypothetical protein